MNVIIIYSIIYPPIYLFIYYVIYFHIEFKILIQIYERDNMTFSGFLNLMIQKRTKNGSK